MAKTGSKIIIILFILIRNILLLYCLSVRFRQGKREVRDDYCWFLLL
ncbi:hypothetical protein A343_1819 [Porphyromonas gingivalis JCVI SC001]|uniref:Uncharacterized protein n=1 Tax=Porphyromonas gingivalis F0570 TaxID=1227271 RepID=A0A0E2LSJ9_PORGN|nr:hypothetical protein A343_1819 [Porphyromonas gingivalis JCVI SC001]ERJ68462.1 hypothetical protein HMPREF1555_00392 [Porphyromonas gingivalis F0570]ERJ70078.1 hypothetical protein HMPREF1553_00421 [Porphyromonas gingivalis F0568]